MKPLTKRNSIGLCLLAFLGMILSGLIAFLPQLLFGSNLLTTILMVGLYIFLYYLFAKWLSRRLGMNLIQFRMTLAKPNRFWIIAAPFFH